MRRRGIYRVQVFTADLVVSGFFSDIESRVSELSTADHLDTIDWSRAVIGFGLSDPRGIVDIEGFHIGAETLRLQPGTTLGGLMPTGFHAPMGEMSTEGFDFSLPLGIRGSGSLRRPSWDHRSRRTRRCRRNRRCLDHNRENRTNR